MKKTFIKIVSRKFLPLLVIATTLFSTASLQSMANSRKLIEIVSTEKTSSVVYTGSTENAMLFDVRIKNPNGSKFTLVVQGEDGEVLFVKNYTDKDFSKKIKMLKSESGTGRFSFSIKSSDKTIENNFAVNTVTRLVDDVIVTKL